MIASVVATVLILAMVAYLANHGLFSALILAVVSILCAAFALNAYPVLARVLAPYQGAYADAVATIALFLLPLIAARFLTDLTVRHNVSFGLWADRIGAGVLGLVASLVLVGTALVIMQMLPFGEAPLGYRAYDDTLQRSQRAWPFCPDDFAVGVARLVSRGALSSEAGFDKVHDDFLLECFCARNTAGKNGRVHATPGALGIQGAYVPPAEQADWLSKVPEGPGMSAGTLSKVVVVACSADSTADDSDGWQRLAGTQFRLVTEEAAAGREAATQPSILAQAGGAASRTGAPEGGGGSYYPLGYLIPASDEDKWLFVPAPGGKAGEPRQYAQLIVEQEKSRALPVHWVYRVPENERPSHMVFRRVAWQAVPKVRKASPPVVRPPAKPGKGAKPEPAKDDKGKPGPSGKSTKDSSAAGKGSG